MQVFGVCNDRQCWNNEKCRCECKELIDKGRCDKGFIWNPSAILVESYIQWNPSICERECDKSCDIGQYLGYKNCRI